MWDNVAVFEEHTSGSPLENSGTSLGCTIHPVDKHWFRSGMSNPRWHFVPPAMLFGNFQIINIQLV